jgi:hypothetical protein
MKRRPLRYEANVPETPPLCNFHPFYSERTGHHATRTPQAIQERRPHQPRAHPDRRTRGVRGLEQHVPQRDRPAGRRRHRHALPPLPQPGSAHRRAIPARHPAPHRSRAGAGRVAACAGGAPALVRRGRPLRAAQIRCRRHHPRGDQRRRVLRAVRSRHRRAARPRCRGRFPQERPRPRGRPASAQRAVADRPGTRRRGQGETDPRPHHRRSPGGNSLTRSGQSKAWS